MPTARKTVVLGFLLALIGPVEGYGTEWGLNDVSLLLPLPGRAAILKDLPLSPAAQGSAGVLLPHRSLEAVSPLTQGFDAVALEKKLKVVGVRIDPCFEMFVGAPCRRQLRLVWQVLLTSGFPGSKTDTADAAVHSFYDLDEPQFERLVADLGALKADYPGPSAASPLEVHPVLKAQGYEGPYWSRLKAIVLSAAGETRLARITFMRALSDSIQWEFGGFDVAGGALAPMEIPLLPKGSSSQLFVQNTFGNALDFKGGSFLPAPPGDFVDFAQDASVSGKWTRDRRKAFLETLDRVENPALSTPARVDCLSCHLAQQARLSLQKRVPDLFEEPRPARFVAPKPVDLGNPSTVPAAVNRLRAFGYYRSEPSVSQRTVHESAAVAEWLNNPSGAAAAIPASPAARPRRAL